MYRPAPPRPRKTMIVRARTGCRNCRARRKKCDEKRPACNACTRLGRRCDGYATKLEFRNVSFQLAESQHPDTHMGEGTVLPHQGHTGDSALHFDIEGAESYPGAPPEEANENPWVTAELSATLSSPTSAVQRTSQSITSGQALCGATTRVGLPMKPTREFFYMTIWDTLCAPGLHPIFRRLSRLQDPSPVIVDTMMALAARHLSRILPRERGIGSHDILGSSFRPDLGQQSISGEFSSSAMRSVAQWTRADFERDWTNALAVLILFCYLESLTSNFQGFYLHSAAVEMLMNINGAHNTRPNSYGAGLIAAWIQSKLHNWWRRFHFGTSAFQRDHPPLSIHAMALPSLAVAENIRLPVLLILCESYRLNAATFMYLCADPVDAELVAPDGGRVPFGTTHPPPSQPSALLGTQQDRLDHQRHALNDWHAQLPPSELPIDSDSSTHSDIDWWSFGLQTEPLRFGSHEAAMNYAYYCTARVMQCTEFLSVLSSIDRHTETSDTCNPVESWVMLLLRVTAGIDWGSCTKLNAYTIGLSGLLLACALRSNNLAIGLRIHDWLNQRYQEGCLEEGSFPIFQILQVLRIINRERRSRRHVYAVCQPIDDGGGAGKFDSYNSQRLAAVLVYGWCMNSNCPYSRRIVLEDMHFGESQEKGEGKVLT